ncbi:hypothetical protein Ddc_19003 [Ditylenchus destructor]|nr:hypothetical protein Ddc_19003 [Ditylenchus destructor]
MTYYSPKHWFRNFLDYFGTELRHTRSKLNDATEDRHMFALCLTSRRASRLALPAGLRENVSDALAREVNLPLK